MAINIKLSNITFCYSPNKVIFERFTLDLPCDRTILITGENGVGKSTLAALASGILSPYKGNVIYNNRIIRQKEMYKVYKELSYLRQIQEHNIIGATPYQDLKLWMPHDILKTDDSEDMCDNILKEWDLYNKKDLPVWELSNGELHSLALAGLSLHQDRYWILDEPITSLDEKNTNQLLKVLRGKKSINKGILLISHNAELFNDLIDETMILYSDGSIERNV